MTDHEYNLERSGTVQQTEDRRGFYFERRVPLTTFRPTDGPEHSRHSCRQTVIAQVRVYGRALCTFGFISKYRLTVPAYYWHKKINCFQSTLFSKPINIFFHGTENLVMEVITTGLRGSAVYIEYLPTRDKKDNQSSWLTNAYIQLVAFGLPLRSAPFGAVA